MIEVKTDLKPVWFALSLSIPFQFPAHTFHQLHFKQENPVNQRMAGVKETSI